MGSLLNFNIDKKKWENFWYYYKIHVFVGVFIAIILIVTLKDCANNIPPDLQISYIGSSYIKDELVQAFEEKISNIITDTNNDGKKETLFQVLPITDEVSEQNIAIQQKIMVELAAGETKLYLVDKQNLQKLGTQGVFEPLDDVAEQYGIDLNANPEVKFTVTDSTEAHIYAVPLKGSLLLKELQIKDDDIYAAIRIMTDKQKQNEEKKLQYENARRALEELAKK